MAMAVGAHAQRYRANLRDELDCAMLYLALAEE
jgi:hypothetical protein